MKKRIGWLRGRPIIEDLGVDNTHYKEIRIQNEPNFEERDIFYIKNGKRIKFHIKNYNKKLEDFYINDFDYKYNSVWKHYYSFSEIYKDLTNKSKYPSINENDIYNLFNNSIYIPYKVFDTVISLEGNFKMNDINISFFQELPNLEEVDIHINSKILNQIFAYCPKLKSLRMLCSNATNLTNIFYGSPLLEDIKIFANTIEKVFSLDFIEDNSENIIQSVKYFMCQFSKAKSLYDVGSYVLNSQHNDINSGINSTLLNFTILGDTLPQVSEITFFCNRNWFIDSIICNMPKLTTINYSFMALYCCRNFHCEMPMLSKCTGINIMTAYNYNKEIVRQFITSQGDLFLKKSRYSSVDDYMNDIYMHSFSIGAFGQADTFSSPLDLRFVFLHRDLTVQMFREWYDRKANGKTAECKIIFNSASFDELTQEDIKIATDKGFTILKN